jgi:hypothetical protein
MILGDGTEVRIGNTYGQGEVGDERGSKEMDRCPLTTTKPKYTANSDEFHKLAEEAFTIPLNQWSYIQCSVVNMTTNLQLLPPKGLHPKLMSNN